MPRFSNHDFIQAQDRLERYWQNAPGVYGYLRANKQWQLHDYFQPTRRLSPEMLLTYRAEISARRPSLPSQADKRRDRHVARVQPLGEAVT